MRKIPATMVTQHPDHAGKPYWHSDPLITVQHETQECFLSFSEIGATEYKWDWEGKFVDEAVVERLLGQYFEYFQKNPLGREKFLTFRLPNPKVQTEFRLGRAFMGILSASGLAKQVGLHSPPLFEVILPMTESAGEMIAIQEAFREITSLHHPLLKLGDEGLKHIEMVPLFEEVNTIMDSDKILDTYLVEHKGIFGFEPEYIRPYVARSDPALNAGIVPTVIAIKIALSHYADWAKKNGIKLFPVIGCAALPFRGGLRPDRIEQFVAEYGGIRTVTIQSAFRYDFDLPTVIEGIKKLEELLPKSKTQMISAKDEAVLREQTAVFAQYYKDTIEGIAPLVNQVSSNLPRRRERVQHIGLFGYSRGIGKVKLPRAIGFTASMYSLGVPPEMIGSGRGLRDMKGKTALLEKYYVNLENDLVSAGRFVNKNVLKKLAKTSTSWKGILTDVQELEKYLGFELKPETDAEKEHHEIVEKIYGRMQMNDSIGDLIVRAAALRKSLG